MCGIAGVLGKSNAVEEVGEMLKKMKHRGPDGNGIYSIDENTAIGMCRLRVRSHIDDTVPFSIDTGITASYNGEIYGTLTNEAEASVASPKGGADEVKTLLTCNENVHADGMYAIAIADQDSIKIKRDPYGIKPLFYRENKDSIFFCSEPAPLIKNVKEDINTDAFDDLLVFGHTLHNQTIYHSINKLPLNSQIHYKDGCYQHITKSNSYYQKKKAPDIHSLISHSVQKCMLSDRPVGLSVSSGLDSRILAHELNMQSYVNLKTVSILIDDVDDGIQHLSQLDLPGKKSWHHWQHFYTQFQAVDFPKYLEQSVLCLGQPTRMTSFPLYLKLAELTHQVDLTVLLSGEGADEIFFGYRDYLEWWPDIFPDTETALLNFYINDKQLLILKDLLGVDRVKNSVRRFKEFIKPFIIENEPRKTLLKIEQALRLGALLERTDLCLMKYSIEGRVPYLHGGIPEQISLLPESSFIHTTHSKYLLRKAYASELPTMHIPKKRFRMPISKWITQDCREWAMDLIQSKNNGLSDIDIDQKQLEQWMQSPTLPAISFAFTLLSFIIWHNHFMKG